MSWTAAAMLASAGIQAGAGLLGGKMSAKEQREIALMNQAFQREVGQNQIQWRVSDAKAAGIHPLYALGTPGISTGPMHIGSSTRGEAFAQAGQDISKGVRGAVAELNANRAAELKVLNASAMKDEAIASYYNSQAKRLENQEGSPGSANILTEPLYGSFDESGNFVPDSRVAGRYRVVPSETRSQKFGYPQMEAGPPRAGYQEVWLDRGMPMMVPATQGEAWQEVWSEMGLAEKLGVIGQNVRMYGMSWYYDMLKYFSGMEPDHQYLPAGKQFRRTSGAPPADFERFMKGMKDWVQP